MDKKFIARSGVLSLGDVVTSGSFLGDGSGLSGVLTGVSASNGITGSGVSGDPIKLGGSLTENTVIDGGNSRTLNLKDLSGFSANLYGNTPKSFIFKVQSANIGYVNGFSVEDITTSAAARVTISATKSGIFSQLFSTGDNVGVGFWARDAASADSIAFIIKNKNAPTIDLYTVGTPNPQTTPTYSNFILGVSGDRDHNSYLRFANYYGGQPSSHNNIGQVTNVLSHLHYQGTWQFFNRLAAPPSHGFTNKFDFYATNYNAEDGKSAPHFITEDGNTIALYPQTAVTSSQGIADALTSIGLLSGSSVIPDPTLFPYTGSAEITGSLVVTGSFRGEVQVLSIASSTASMDLSTGNFFELTLATGSDTYLNPTNIQPGQTINLKINQPATSGSLSYGSEIKFPGGIPYLVSATGSVVDILSMISFDSTTLYATSLKNLS